MTRTGEIGVRNDCRRASCAISNGITISAVSCRSQATPIPSQESRSGTCRESGRSLLPVFPVCRSSASHASCCGKGPGVPLRRPDRSGPTEAVAQSAKIVALFVPQNRCTSLIKRSPVRVRASSKPRTEFRLGRRRSERGAPRAGGTPCYHAPAIDHDKSLTGGPAPWRTTY